MKVVAVAILAAVSVLSSCATKEEKGSAGASMEKTMTVVLDAARGVKMEFVRIPAGRFRMGDDGGEPEEKPVHEVEITRDYWMGVTEVTQGQWEAVTGGNPSNWKGADLPVEQVSWEDSQGFVRKLNERCGEQAGGKQFALPTEGEWEYACRGGGTGKWSYGDDESKLEEYGWYDKNSGSQTHPVGQKKPNGFGLYDMHGNVWEWCEDWYGGDGSGSVKDPQGALNGQYRVLRSGSWCNGARNARSAIRFRDVPTFRHINVGLRVVLR